MPSVPSKANRSRAPRRRAADDRGASSHGGAPPAPPEAPSSPAGASPRRAWAVRAAAALIVAAGVAVYLNSFRGQFLFDDDREIVYSPHARRLWPPWQAVKGARPLVDVSLALNFRLDELWARAAERTSPPPGLGVWGYHLFNVTVHVLAALVLFGVVRRTLLAPAGLTGRLGGRFGAAATPLAAASALLWMLHPLQTASVTYVIQRAESMMGLFYLLTLYCAIRGLDSPRRGSPRPGRWFALAALASAGGMGSKQVMVTAPLAVLLYHRLLRDVPFREILRRRWPLYASLAGTWAVLAVLAAASPGTTTAGFNMARLSWSDYAATEFGVILRYLRLAFWPVGQCLDYWWPPARSFWRIAPQALVVGALLGATVWAIRRRPSVGFCGAWFFLVLAPTSSVMPIADPIYEHRMYLSLAAVMVLAVVGGFALLGPVARRAIRSHRLRAAAAVACVALPACGLGALTVRRNRDYHSVEGMWRDVMKKRPENPRAYLNLALTLDDRLGRVAEAVGLYRQAIRLRPNHPKAYSYLGAALRKLGNQAEGLAMMAEAVRVGGDDPVAHNNLAVALADQGKLADAAYHYRRALAAKPDFAEAHCNLAVVLALTGDSRQALEELDRAIELRPDWADPRYNAGLILAGMGRMDEAIERFGEALRLKPDYAEAHCKLGIALLGRSQRRQAAVHLDAAGRIKPELAEAHYFLGVILAAAGEHQAAAGRFREALRRGHPVRAAANNLAWLLATSPDADVRDGPEAVRLARRALEAGDGADPSILDTLAAAYAEAGQFQQAVRTTEQAIALTEKADRKDLTEKLRRRAELYRAGQPFRDRSGR